jgi:outer membrane protein TolC
MFSALLLIMALSLTGWAMGIEEAINEGIKNNPELRSMREELRIYEGLERSLGAFPNPEVTLEGSGEGLYLFELSQELPLWGTRSKGRALAKKLRESFELKIKAKEREVAGEIYLSFMNALFLKEMIRIAEENFKTAKEVKEFTERAYRLGETTLLNLLRSKTELDMARAELETLRALYRSALTELSMAVGKEVSDVEGNLENIKKPIEVIPSQTPLILSLEREIESFGERISLERRRAIPSPKAGIVIEESDKEGYEYRGLLSFDLPLFYRRQGEIIEAASIRRSLLERKRGESFRLAQRIKSITDRWNILEGLLKELEEKTIPTAKEELDLALRSYSNLTISLLELSDTRKRYYEVLKKRAEILKELHSLYGEFISIGGWR